MSSKKETYSNKVHHNVDKFYYDNHRVRKSGKPQALNIYQNNNGKLEGGRQHDPIYNNENVGRQTFTHLLGDENTAVHNYGAGGTGLDFAVKTLSEVYMPESRRQIFIITVPHFFRRTWFDDDGVILRAWQVKEQTDINEYNNYYNFLHNYELLNRFVGRDKIIWGTWDMDLPKDKFDVFFERIDYTEDGLHPGPKSHKQYAEKIKDVLQNRFK